MKKAGILLPVTSLPSDYGIGCISDSAYKFIDFLSSCGQSYWQVLPLSPTSYGDSPYQSPSAFAGNPYMISLKDLISKGLLEEKECEAADYGDNLQYIDYEKIYNCRYPLLKKAYKRANLNTAEFKQFETEHAFWLEDYSLFMAIKQHFDMKEWTLWPEDIRLKTEGATEKYRNLLKDEIIFWKFVQYLFFEQWQALKSYANKKGISIIGDIPIYTASDSADVWANRQLFQLDEEGIPTSVAGCPPDGFSEKGQLWGNPLYNWENHKKENFDWWIKRIKHNFKLFNTLRIDHFRGFDQYYSIPYGREDAVIGSWEDGPGAELFDAVKKALGEKDIIAEDLGFITDTVRKLLKDTGFAGIKVLEFAFDSRDTGFKNDYLPHNYPENCVAYTGTHDNQTLVSWINDISEDELKTVRNYLWDEYTPKDKLGNPLIALIMRSCAKLCIIPLQDYMCCDDSARINIPSTLGCNWKWRITKAQLSEALSNKILNMTKRFGRI